MNFSFERDRTEQLLRLYPALGSGKLRFEIGASAMVRIRTAIRLRVRVGARFRPRI